MKKVQSLTSHPANIIRVELHGKTRSYQVDRNDNTQRHERKQSIEY